MKQASILNTLNRLYIIENRSLAMYMVDSCPWTHSGDEKASQVIAHIVADQKAMSQRLADLIDAREGRLHNGSFPMQFTDLNMVSLDYLVGELARLLRQDIEAIRACVEKLDGDREAKELAEEILGAEQAHLEALEDLTPQPA
jgi:ferritin-like metal-binding protein YciE